jgi:hypothetical protein
MPKIRNRVFATIFTSRFNLSKKPGFFDPPHKSETGFLPQSLLPRFNLSKKPGFFDPPHKKPGFSHPCAGGADL